MPDNQLPLFTRKSFPAVSAPSPLAPVAPTAESTVMSTLVAYRVYVSSVSESKYTPQNFFTDIKKFALFVREKKIKDIDVYAIREWIEILQSPKGENLQPKTVSRKISALHHYFLWLGQEGVIRDNPMERIGY